VVLYTMECYSTMRKEDTLPFSRTWTDLEHIMQEWEKTDRKRQVLHDTTYVWNLKSQACKKTESKMVVSGELGCQYKIDDV